MSILGVQSVAHPLASGAAYAGAQVVFGTRPFALDKSLAMTVAEQTASSVGAEMLAPNLSRMWPGWSDQLLRPLATGALLVILDRYVLGKKEGSSMLYTFLLSAGSEAVTGQVLDRGLLSSFNAPTTAPGTRTQPPRDRYIG